MNNVAETVMAQGMWENEQTRQRDALPGRYTPLVPRPKGGAL